MQVQLYGNKIWVLRRPVDFRKSICGLSAIISVELKREVREGIYVFYNRGCDKIKCLSWHKNGFILLYKQMAQGRFNFKFNEASGQVEIGVEEVNWLLAGLPWQQMRNWRELNYDKFT